MTKTKKIISSLAAIVLIAMAGCEWSSPSSDETWTMNGYDWFDFSGTYGANGDAIVTGYTYENSSSEEVVTGEVVASLSSAQSSFGGSFDNTSVVAGTVTIFAGSFSFVDDGFGYLVTTSADITGEDVRNVADNESLNSTPVAPGFYSGSFAHSDIEVGSVTIVVGNSIFTEYFATSADYTRAETEGFAVLVGDIGTGTINYNTGAWSISLDVVAEVTDLSADYVYITTTTSSTASGTINYTTGTWSINLGGSTASGNVTANYAYTGDQPFEAGNSGTPIITLSIAQVGNKLTIYDSQGRQFDGTIGVANGSGGTTAPSSEDDYSTYVTAQFTAYYGDIEIVGSFTGLYTSDQPGVLFDRSIQAVWIEPGIQGDVSGAAPSIEVPEFVSETTTINIF